MSVGTRTPSPIEAQTSPLPSSAIYSTFSLSTVATESSIMDHPEDIEEQPILNSIARIPTGPAAGMYSSSKKWVSPAEFERQQQAREEKTAKHAKPKRLEPPIRNAWLQEFSRIHGDWCKVFPKAQSYLPRSFKEYEEHRRWEAGTQRGMKKKNPTESKVALTSLVAFAGKVWKHGDLRGSVLCQYTIWTKDTQPQKAHASHWPSLKEFKYEGDDRHATAGQNFHHFLPLPRDWRQELRVLHVSQQNQNYKYWEEFPRHYLFTFDHLQADRPRSHLEIYPFSIDCMLKDCGICWDYRMSFGLLSGAAFDAAVANYKRDVSAEVMECCLGADVVSAINDDNI